MYSRCRQKNDLSPARHRRAGFLLEFAFYRSSAYSFVRLFQKEEFVMNESNKKESLSWLPNTDPAVVAKMFQYKIEQSYQRPSQLDIEAQKAIVISKRSTCLFYEVGASIFYVKNGIYHLSDGYNGASKGDVDPRVEGCARIVDGVLRQGEGRVADHTLS